MTIPGLFYYEVTHNTIISTNSSAFSAEPSTTLSGKEKFLVNSTLKKKVNYSSSSAKPVRENHVCTAVPVEHMKLRGLFQTHKHFLQKRDSRFGTYT